MSDSMEASVRSSGFAAPASHPPISHRLLRAALHLSDRFRARLGLHRRVTIGDIRYLERSHETLRRALSRKGSGSKEYDVVFPGGHTMRITCCGWRVYADLMGPRLLPCYEAAQPAIRPGMRVLDFGCGTGYGAAWLVEQVGPSGAVVAVDRDAESIAYAQRRYAAPNVAFETGWTDALAGETDGAFQTVVSFDTLRAGDDAYAMLTELWRVVAPGGWLMIVAPTPLGGVAPQPEMPLTLEPATLADLIKRACVVTAPRPPEDYDHGAESRPAATLEPGAPSSPVGPPAPSQVESVSGPVQSDHCGILVRKPDR